ncbi:MAG TPA: hypothetical protein PLJ50_12325, partial [Candidatus Latescibacteria bacterium]|nr:hypothetical protein [Candidatus Latescibacterota bacterium]
MSDQQPEKSSRRKINAIAVFEGTGYFSWGMSTSELRPVYERRNRKWDWRMKLAARAMEQRARSVRL